MKARGVIQRLRPGTDGMNGAAIVPEVVRPRRRLAGGALGVATLLVALLVLSPFGCDGDRRPAEAGRAIPSTTVKRRTLVERERVEGTLGYSGARTVVNRLATGDGASGGGSDGGGRSGSLAGSSAGSGSGAGVSGSKSGGDGRGRHGGGSAVGGKPSGGGGPKGRGSSGGGGGASGGGSAPQGSGTVTRLAREGSIVDRGDTLYALDDRPVILMYGQVPAYRALTTATTDGLDVRQLEQNLAALGFGAGVTVDEHFSAATAAAVTRWQRSLGLPQTGQVELGRVVFLPGARRVGSHRTKVGGVAGAGTAMLETTSVKRGVTVELDAAKQSLVRRGDTVTVTLPDGTTLRGRITRIGRVAREKDEGDGAGGDGAPGASGSGSGDLVIDLSIALRSRRGVSRLDQAPVTVGIAQETRRRVLAVPVTALLARPGGGYGVEVVRGGRRRLVAVETGLFANGLVEVSGRRISEGTKVAIPEEA